MTLAPATEPIIRAKLAKAGSKHHRAGVLGIRAQPEWGKGSFVHDGISVSVVGCPSVLSIWAAIEDHRADQWTVVLTSVEEDELGSGILAHLVDGRLLLPDPWDALRENFSAATIEPALYRVSNDRALASGLLTVLSSDAYSPAPGGVLTRDHAMAAVSTHVLGLSANVATVLDVAGILQWSRHPDSADKLRELESVGGSELTSAFGNWLAHRAGDVAAPTEALLASDKLAALVPLGLIVGLFDNSGAGQRAQGLVAGTYNLHRLSTQDLENWSAACSGLFARTSGPQRSVDIQAAAAIVDELGIDDLASQSLILPHGLTARVSRLSQRIEAAVRSSAVSGVVDSTALADAELSWATLQEHALAREDATCRSMDGAIHLLRWLATQPQRLTGLTECADRYVTTDSWVDTAIRLARRGSDVADAAAALRVVIDAATQRRSAHDIEFATALASTEVPTMPLIENVLREVVFPVARMQPTLLLVVDALSVSVATEIVEATAADGWSEVSQLDDGARAAALAALPTLTSRSRCSLLCGELTQGNAPEEARGFTTAARSAGLQPANAGDIIFHKQRLDGLVAGASVATDVANALFDTSGRSLVAAVLNYVDDNLHHTDPGGTEWTLDTITHLRPLLRTAKNAGRTVIITSDHGHIIDHGDGEKLTRAHTYGLRAHGDMAAVEAGREVLVSGPRVMTESRKAVLAVDERVRYGNRNAGYHGGASPAEAVVPVVVLTAAQSPDGLRPVGRLEPSWWDATAPSPAVEESVAVLMTKSKKAKRPVTEDTPSLFDTPVQVPTQDVTSRSQLAAHVVKSKVFRQQIDVAGRLVLSTAQMESLLQALLDTPAHEIPVADAAAAMNVGSARVNGALAQAKSVFDVEGYQVLHVGGGAVGLDIAALREQFGVTE